MLRLILLIAFAPALAMTAQAQWAETYEEQTNFFDLAVVSADTVVIAADYGRILRSFDGGGSWSAFQTPFNWEYLTGIHFPTPLVGYACGGSTDFGEHPCCIAKTIDGGVTWAPITSGEYGNGVFQDIEFVNQDTGFVAGGNLRLGRTTDGGTTFIGVVGNDIPPITCFGFANAQNGVIATWRYNGGTADLMLLRTTDMGGTWDTVYTDFVPEVSGIDPGSINAIQFLDGLNGFAVGGYGRFLRTSDGGASWQQSIIPPGAKLSALWFMSPSVGYVNNDGGISRTDDGGATWTSQSVDPVERIDRIMMDSDSIGYAMSEERIYKTTNAGGATPVRDLPRSEALRVVPNPACDIVRISGAGNEPIIALTTLDATGRTVPIVLCNDGNADVSLLPQGCYVITARTAPGLLRSTLVISR